MNRLESISRKSTAADYATGAFQQNTRPVGEFLAPSVAVAGHSGLYKRWSEKSRFYVPNTLRELGGPATEIASDASDGKYNCAPQALDFPIDNAVGDEEAKMLSMDAVDYLSDIYGLAHLYETLIKAKEAAGAGVNKNYDPLVDPVELIDAEVEAVLLAGKCEEAGVLFGASAWRRFKNHPLVAARRQVMKWELNPALFTADARYMGCFAVVDTAPEGIDPVMDFLLKNEVIVFGRHPAPHRRDPSFMKTFRESQWIKNVRTKKTNDGRKTLVMLDWSAEIQVTNSTAVKRINYLPAA